jgi:predicted DNA-binding protein (MmcQ/YjbR family)
MPRKRRISDAAVSELQKFGLAYPEAHTKSPWPGHLDLAVKDKTFAYLSVPGEPFKLSCKLPYSNVAALSLPFAEPTAYGLGKSGWVSAQFADDEAPPVEMFKSWIDESYRAIAPKKLVAQLDEAGAAKPAAKPAKRKKVAKKAAPERKR